MELNIGYDTLIIWWRYDAIPDKNELMLELLRRYELNQKVFILSLSDSDAIINAQMHNIYRSSAGCGWQKVPVVITVLIEYTTASRNYIRSNRLMKALKTLAFNSLFRLRVIKDDIEYDQIMLSYPVYSTPLFGENTTIGAVSSWGNFIRRNSIRFMGDNYNSQDILLVGVNPYSLSVCIREGMLPKLIEISDAGQISPYSTNLTKVDVYQSTTYRKPDLIKLEILHDLLFSRLSNLVLYVGGAPGRSLIHSNYCSKWMTTPTLVMFDPKFTTEYRDERKRLMAQGWKVNGKTFNYDYRQVPDLLVSDTLTVCDDAYIIGDQFKFTLDKIIFYTQLIADRIAKNKTTIVYLKFNFPDTLRKTKTKPSIDGSTNNRSVDVDYLVDVMLQPGINDSNEVRLILGDKGGRFTLTRDMYMSNLFLWRKITLREQLNKCVYYFRHLIIQADFYTIYKRLNVPTIALYSLTNTLNGDLTTVTQKIRDMVYYYNDLNIPLICSFPNPLLNLETLNSTDVTITYNANSTCINTKYLSAMYDDVLVPLGDLIQIGLHDILPYHLLNYLNYNRTDEGISTIPMYSRSHVIMVNDHILHKFTPQDGRCSPGPIIKAWTSNWRLEKQHSSKETYALRLALIRQNTDINSNLPNVSLIGGKDHTFSVKKSFRLTVTSGPLKNRFIECSAGEKITVSGHLLNIATASIYGFSMLGLWIAHWRTQQRLDKDSAILADLKLAQMHYQLYDYNTSLSIKDKWHLTNDLLLALIILPDYVAKFDLPFKNLEHIAALTDSLWSILTDT